MKKINTFSRKAPSLPQTKGERTLGISINHLSPREKFYMVPMKNPGSYLVINVTLVPIHVSLKNSFPHVMGGGGVSRHTLPVRPPLLYI